MDYSIFVLIACIIFICFWVFVLIKIKPFNKLKNTTKSEVEISDLILEIMELEQKVEDLKKQKTQTYKERNILVALLAQIYPSGIKKTQIEGWDPEWHNCVFIELPDGTQCSWHYHDRDSYLFENLPPYQKEWDGHTTENKYFNIEELIASGCLIKK